MDINTCADRLLTALDTSQQVLPLSETDGLSMPEAYQVAARIAEVRQARGERLVGRKIGFTNRTIWQTYNVDGPMWGDLYDSTLHRLDSLPARVPLPVVPEPRIEPEIVFGFRSAPRAEMDDAELAGTIDWVAHGFEVVTSVYSGWSFGIADCTAAFGMHGALFVGPARPFVALGAEPAAALAGLEIALESDSGKAATGRGADVLDGPLNALRFLLNGLARAPDQRPVVAGDVVTTGTLTDALPLVAGERWRTRLTGVNLPGLDVTFTGPE